MKPKRPKYRAVCLQCYTCYLTQPTTKKDAEVAATSHWGAYGHNVSVQEVQD